MLIKLIITGRRRANQTLAEHRRYMKEVHGKLVLEYIAAHPEKAPKRYVQNHVFDGWFSEREPAHNFFTELWFDSPLAAKESKETDFYKKKLRPDESKMVEQSSVISMVATEEKVAGNHDPKHSIKVSIFHKAAAQLRREDFLKKWKAKTVDLGEASLHIRCSVLSPGPIDGVDQFWFPNETTAQRFCSKIQKNIIDPLCKEGIVSKNTGMMLMAKVYELF